MSITATTSSLYEPLPSYSDQLFNHVYQIGTRIGLGLLANHIFSIIHPLGSVIFAASSGLTFAFNNVLIEKLDVTALKINAWVISAILGLAIGAFATTAAGFPLTIGGACSMTLAMSVTSIGLVIILKIGMIAFSCIGGAGLALKERFQRA